MSGHVGCASGFALRPEANLVIGILADGDATAVGLSNLAKVILDDFESAGPGDNAIPLMVWLGLDGLSPP